MRVTISRQSKEGITIIGISLILNVMLFLVEEAKYSIVFLLKPGELAMLLFFTFGFSTAPMAIHGFVGNRHPEKSFRFSLFGFAPPLIILVWLVFA